MTDEPSRPDQSNRQRTRWLPAALAASTLLTLLGTAWLAITGLDARNNLTAARAAVGRLHAGLVAGDAKEAGAQLVIAQRRATDARCSTSGIVWAMAAQLPLVGRPLRTARGLTGAADVLARSVLPALTDAEHTVQRSASSPGSGDAVDLAALQSAASPLADAASHLAGIEARLSALPGHTGIALLDQARTTFLQQISRLDGTVNAAVTATRLLPPMLGIDHPRRYFFALQTNAEARGTGGLVGAFSVLVADHGHLTFNPFVADDSLPAAPNPVISYGPEFDHRYADAESTQLLANSNLSPHFPFAAQIWTRLWQQHTGHRLDGAIATDPVGLADLLTATGPVTLPDGGRLTAANTVAFTERDLYGDYPDAATRKKVLTHVAQSVAVALSSQRPTAPGLLKALSAMAADGRLKVWSTHRTEERQLAGTPLGGVLPDTSQPFAELIVNNAAASKLDYYLDRRLEYLLGSCRNGTRTSTVRIRLTNTVPRNGLPDYVANRSDDPQHMHVRGSTLAWVSLYTTRGAQLIRASLDGWPLLMSVDRERGHTVLSTRVELLPGQHRDLELHLLEPAIEQPALTPVQPLVRPQTTVVSVQPCRIR